MAKKLSELDSDDKIYFETVMNFMNETSQDDLRQRLKVAQKFGLDLTDDNVMQLLAPASSSESTPISLPAQVVKNHDVATMPSQKATQVYGENWIVLQNRLLNAISDLDLNERRLIMFLSPLVRKAVDIDTLQRTFVVRVQDFQAEYGIRSKRYYDELEKTCMSLTNKSYIFWDFYNNQKKQSKIQVSWLTKSVYQNGLGEIHVDLHNDVVEMLTVFDKSNPFTKYERQQIISLGSYGIVLFELIASCMHQKYKQKSYTIEYLREKFNCVDSYLTATDFKRYVLDRAIKDIEKHTSYRITYTQKKKGRVVHEIVFSFKDLKENAITKDKRSRGEKSLERDPNTIDWINNQTDTEASTALNAKQIARVVNSKKFMADYAHLVMPQNPANASTGAWITHMATWLKKDPSNFNKRPMKDYLDDEQADRF